MGISFESPLLPSLPNHPQKHFVIPNETFLSMLRNVEMRDLPHGAVKFLSAVLPDDSVRN